MKSEFLHKWVNNYLNEKYVGGENMYGKLFA